MGIEPTGPAVHEAQPALKAGRHTSTDPLPREAQSLTERRPAANVRSLGSASLDRIVLARSAPALSIVPLILLALSTLAGETTARERAASGTQAPVRPDPPAEEGPLVVSRGAGWDPLVIPRNEELDYDVEIDVGLLGDLQVGRVTLSTGQEPYLAGLPAPGGTIETEPTRRVGWIRSQARGAYLGYELRHELETRHLPQAWPSVLYRDSQAGSENRRRELKLGLLDGHLTAIYRHDGHCKGCRNPEHFVESTWMWGQPYHCGKCKRAEHRVWSGAESREIAPGTVDLLTAVYLARSMIQDGRAESTIPVIDKQKQWILTITRGAMRTIETPAGRFRCALAQLDTRVPPDESRAENSKFQGLFGIQGTIKIWMDVATGIPVLISGELPVPVIQTLDLNVRLRSYRGTPKSFAPVR